MFPTFIFPRSYNYIVHNIERACDNIIISEYFMRSCCWYDTSARLRYIDILWLQITSLENSTITVVRQKELLASLDILIYRIDR